MAPPQPALPRQSAHTAALDTSADISTPADGIAAGAEVRHLPLNEVLEDQTYMFRANVRVGDLKMSIQDEGQQIPVVVRPRPFETGNRYQLISGFRRRRAMQELGATTIAAIIRRDLDDDEAAFRASVLENTARRTYSDIDRAIVIKRYQDEGHSSTDVAAMMGLTKRRKNMIMRLLSMPPVVQEAIDDPAHPMTSKHAIQLARLKSTRYPGLDWDEWVDNIQASELSVNQMVRAANAELGAQAKQQEFTGIFQGRGTNLKKGEVWFAPVRVKLGDLTSEERKRLRSELEALLAEL